MYDLESIIAQNQRAEALGIIKAGSAVGTTGYRPGDRHPSIDDGGPSTETKGHSEWQGGLRGHSIGDTYPWQCAAGVDEGVTIWTVTNYLTGEDGHTYRGLPESKDGCARAHRECELRAKGLPVHEPVTTINPEY